MGCWEVVDIDTLPNDANLIGVKWVFKLKYKNSEYELHKARIVALGYQQCKNVDYFASFLPTASYVMIRLVLALTALPHWYGVDLDATGTFISVHTHLNIHGCSVVAPSLHAPCRAPLLLPLLLSHNIPLPRVH